MVVNCWSNLATNSNADATLGKRPEGADEKSNDFIPLILFIKETSHLEKVIGKEFEQKLGEHLGLDVPFARIGKYDGNVVFDRSVLTQEKLDQLL